MGIVPFLDRDCVKLTIERGAHDDTYQSGSAVGAGAANAARWLWSHAEDGKPPGPGGGEGPTIAALLLVPILGATFLMFLPSSAS
jgi:hypothetical protein